MPLLPCQPKELTHNHVAAISCSLSPSETRASTFPCQNLILFLLLFIFY